MSEIPLNKYEWQPPQLLGEGHCLFDWPVEAFPEPFGAFVKELARSTETPVDLAAMLTLATISAISQHRYRVQAKEDYSEPMSLWVVGVLPPASRKSGVFHRVTEPLKRWEVREKQRLEPEIKKASSRRQTMEERLKILRNRAAKADDSERQELQEQIERLEGEMPHVPTCPRLIVADITPEKLGDLMAVNHGAMSVLSDEGGIFDILGGLYSDGKANIDLFLQSYSGSRVRIDRKSSPPIEIDRALLTIGLTIQPSVIEGLGKTASFRGRGLLGRILYIMPHSNIGRRNWNEASMNRDIMGEYERACEAVLQHCMSGQKSILSLTSEAYALWQKNALNVEKAMSSHGGWLSHMTDWAGKLPGAIIRIAGNLHVMRHKDFDPELIPISVDTMQAAIRIGKALERHALAVFEFMEIGGAKQDAQIVYRWIQSERLIQFYRRDCSRKFRRIKKDAMTAILDVLVEHNIIADAVLQGGKIGRPRDLFAVNQMIIDGYAGK